MSPNVFEVSSSFTKNPEAIQNLRSLSISENFSKDPISISVFIRKVLA